MENAGYLFAAYTTIWALVFGFVLSLYLKQRKLQRDIDLLKESLDEK